MLAAAALGALGAQLEQLQAAKQDWFVGASLVDEQDISLEADGAVTVRRQAFDKALRNFPKTDSPSKAKAARKMEVTDYDQVIAGERFCSRSERQALASAAATTWWSSTSVSRVRRLTGGCCACRACLGFEYDCGCPLWRCNAMDQDEPCVIGPGGCAGCSNTNEQFTAGCFSKVRHKPSKQTVGTAFPFYKEGAMPAACLDSLSPARELIQCITQLAALWQHLGQRG